MILRFLGSATASAGHNRRSLFITHAATPPADASPASKQQRRQHPSEALTQSHTPDCKRVTLQ